MTGGVLAVAWSPVGADLLTGCKDRIARLWRAPGPEPVDKFKGHLSWVGAVAWHLSGTCFATGSMDRTVRLWSPESDSMRHLLHAGTGDATCLAFDRAGTRLWVGGSDGTVRIWGLASKNWEQTVSAHSGIVTAVTPSNATDLVATAGTDGSVRFWTSTDASCVREVLRRRCVGRVVELHWHPSCRNGCRPWSQDHQVLGRPSQAWPLGSQRRRDSSGVVPERRDSREWMFERHRPTLDGADPDSLPDYLAARPRGHDHGARMGPRLEDSRISFT